METITLTIEKHKSHYAAFGALMDHMTCAHTPKALPISKGLERILEPINIDMKKVSNLIPLLELEEDVISGLPYNAVAMKCRKWAKEVTPSEESVTRISNFNRMAELCDAISEAMETELSLDVAPIEYETIKDLKDVTPALIHACGPYVKVI